MSGDEPCPRCGEDVSLVDPSDKVWLLDPADFDEDAEVWLCVSCGWNEEATPEESLAEHTADMEWLIQRLEKKP